MKNKILYILGSEIHYYTNEKKNSETIMFLHPAFCDHTCFDLQIDFFSKNYNLITIDMIGHGASKINKTKDKLDGTAKHINMIMEKESIEKIHIVGVSMGSLMAQYFAFLFPSKVISVTALGGYNIHTINNEINKNQRKAIFDWILKAIFSIDSFRKYVTSQSVINSDSIEKFYFGTQGFTRRSFTVMSGLENVIKDRKDYKITYPLMVLTGEKDTLLAHNAALRWKKSDSRIHHKVISSAGHCANMDNADEFNKVLSEFLN